MKIFTSKNFFFENSAFWTFDHEKKFLFVNKIRNNIDKNYSSIPLLLFCFIVYEDHNDRLDVRHFQKMLKSPA